MTSSPTPITKMLVGWHRPCVCAALLLGAFASLLGGCAGPDPKMVQLIADLQAYRDDNAKLQRENRDLTQTGEQQEKRILTLMGLGDKRLELLFVAKAVEIGRHSGPINEDGKPGDEGIRVYLKPTDRDGSVIKAAGSVKIEMYDLSNATLVNCYEFPVEEVGKHWESGFITYQYRFDCRWHVVPANPEVTVRATFVDYLTGETHSDQKLIRVTLPPTSQPATSQAATQQAATTTATCPAPGTLPTTRP